jgi:hypothetical protein
MFSTSLRTLRKQQTQKDDTRQASVPVLRGNREKSLEVLLVVSGGADGNVVLYNPENPRETSTIKYFGFPGFYNGVVTAGIKHCVLQVQLGGKSYLGRPFPPTGQDGLRQRYGDSRGSGRIECGVPPHGSRRGVPDVAPLELGGNVT